METQIWELGWPCLSVDVSFVHNSGETSWDAVIRNHQGQVLHHTLPGIPFQTVQMLKLLKLFACLEGLKFATTVVESRLNTLVVFSSAILYRSLFGKNFILMLFEVLNSLKKGWF
jgi:hypothetical protein